MGMLFGARRGRRGFSFGSGRRVWKFGEEGVDVEGKRHGVERGLVEEGTCQIAETELLCCRGGSTGSWIVGYWEKILNSGLGLLRSDAGVREGERDLHVRRGGGVEKAL